MKKLKWFDRKFEFDFGPEKYKAVFDKLTNAPRELEVATTDVSEDMLTQKPEGKWSVKEHIGHLIVLEELWRERIFDFEVEKPELTPADLDNKATEEGKFNDYNIADLLQMFGDARQMTLHLLDGITEEELLMTSVHPRLKQPMRLIDHLHFVAEHDEHHIAHIREYINERLW